MREKAEMWNEGRKGGRKEREKETPIIRRILTFRSGKIYSKKRTMTFSHQRSVLLVPLLSVVPTPTSVSTPMKSEKHLCNLLLI